MDEHQQFLIDMGFPKEKVILALQKTYNAGIEQAMEWLLEHADSANEQHANTAVDDSDDSDLVENADENTNNAVAGSEGAATPTVAKSLKCEDCGKLFRDNVEAEYHAVRTNHSNFSESTEEKKPLTAEEIQAQKLLVDEKIKQKRIEREERERRDELERERNRIRSGKDMTEARRKMEQLEMQKLVEQRKREKSDEKVARERVRAQIEADKAKRKFREPETTPDENKTTSTASSPAQAKLIGAINVPATVADSSPAKKEYTHTRIQIRLRDGSTISETFSVKEQLSAVRVFIQVNTETTEPFALMTSFPRKIFTDDDYEKPLEALELVPSAVIIMKKP